MSELIYIIARPTFNYVYNILVHVRWGPCPHSMARPRVTDGGTTSSFGG
jgi:hypothetical protein